MLAFDIETTGLDGSKHLVTVVSTEDYHTGERISYEFDRVRKQEPQNLEKLREDLVQAFNAATSLCAFNGIRFDIPFLRKALRIDHDTVNAWIFKTTDILEACRLGQFGPKHTFGLNLLCEHNGIKMKTSSGLEAIRMAHNNQWDRLRDYCVEDVRILCDLYRKKLLKNPRGHAQIDLTRIAHPDLYKTPIPDADVAKDPMQLEAAVEAVEAAEVVDPKDAQIAALQRQVAELQAQLKIYTDFCSCL